MNISLTSKDWLYKIELLPGPVLLMVYAVLMSPTAHLLQLPFPSELSFGAYCWWQQEHVHQRLKCQVSALAPGLNMRYLRGNWLFAFCSLIACWQLRETTGRVPTGQNGQSDLGRPYNLHYFAQGGRFPTFYTLKTHRLLWQKVHTKGHWAGKPRVLFHLLVVVRSPGRIWGTTLLQASAAFLRAAGGFCQVSCRFPMAPAMSPSLGMHKTARAWSPGAPRSPFSAGTCRQAVLPAAVSCQAGTEPFLKAPSRGLGAVPWELEQEDYVRCFKSSTQWRLLCSLTVFSRDWFHCI